MPVEPMTRSPALVDPTEVSRETLGIKRVGGSSLINYFYYAALFQLPCASLPRPTTEPTLV